MPPISRLEESASQIRRCLRLRRTVSDCLYTLLERYVRAQKTIRSLADTANLEKYYDIYEISTEELYEAESALAERGTEDQYSLRALRTLFGKLYTVRKSVLCCLLALSADGSGSDITTWSTAVEEMRDLAVVTGNNIKKMTNILSEQDRKCLDPCAVAVANFLRRGYPAITIAIGVSGKGFSPCTIPKNQLTVSRNSCSSCKDACAARGVRC